MQIQTTSRCRAMVASFALIAAGITTGCATTGEENVAALQSAEAQYAEATRTARIGEFANRNLQLAERHLRRAQALAEEGAEVDDIEHYSFLAEHHVEVAQARLNRGLIQEEIEDADRRRQELLLASEQRQSARSQSQASKAQQRAEEAEARLALTKQELEQSQEAASSLAEELSELKVEEDERGMILTLSDVVFDVDSDELNEGGERSVERVAEALKKHRQARILIEGYTDSTGSDAYNADLSERRARAVKSAFVESGIPDQRIHVEGYGEAYPVASNDTPQGRQMNRRVEIVVSTDGEPVARRSSS